MLGLWMIARRVTLSGQHQENRWLWPALPASESATHCAHGWFLMPTAFLTPLRPVRWCVLVLVACAGQTGFGYQPPGFQRGPSCDTLPPAPCGPPACQPACPPRCQSCCTCQECREQPRSVPEQPRDAAAPRPAAPPSELRETGFYQAGPRSGALEGGHSTFGFRGGALTLPKIRLELPSIELPSFFRTSYAAKMRVAESEAPWTSTGFQRVTYAEEAAQGRGADPQPDARDTAEPRAAAPADLKAKYEAKLEELCRKIEACEQMRQQLEQSLHCPPPYVPAPHCAPAPPPAAPSAPTASCVPGHSCAPLPHAAAPHATGRPHATTPPRPAGLPPNAPQQTPKAGPNPPVPPGITAPPSLTTTTGTAVPSPPQPRLPEEVRALPAEPTGGATAGWRSPDAAAGDRTAAEPQPANPQPHDRPLPAPQTPAPNPFGAAPPTATHPAAATPWQPLPPPATAWIPPGDAHAASTAVATGPHSHAKPQRLPSR